MVVNPTTGQGERIRLARAALTRPGAFPYYYPLAFGLTLVETEAVPSMRVDARLRLFYNPRWVETLSDPELLGVLWHELHHVLREHVFERGVLLERFLRGAIAEGLRGEKALERLREVWGEALRGEEASRGLTPGEALVAKAAAFLANVVFDLEVNDDAEGAGLVLPEGVLYPERFALPPHLSAEEYANLLLEEARRQEEEEGGASQGTAQGGGGGEGSSREEGEGFAEALGKILQAALEDLFFGDSAEALEREHPELREVGVSEAAAKIAVRQTAEEILEHAAKHPGTVPLGILRAAEAILKPRVDWRSLLRERVQKGVMDLLARERPTFQRPHRRQGALSGVLLPGSYGIKPEVAVVVDTSGSMGERELAQALGEVQGLLRHYRPTVYTVDAEVHAVSRVFRAEEVRLLGGGGTDMGRGVERAVKDGHELVVVLTDGYTPWPESPPRAQVVVGLLHPEGSDPPELPPWAKAVRIPVRG